MNSTWKKEELHEESIIIAINMKDVKIDCNNYRGLSLLSATYNILSNILLTSLTP
jgi:hypothetical protein